MNFDEAVKYIEDTPKFFKSDKRNKSGNDNLRLVMDKLSNPQDKYPCIHVAGTNGKGSTVRMTMSILACLGYKVATFTSPHLERINERITVSHYDEVSEQIVNTDISDEEFLSCFEKVVAAVDVVVKNGGSHLSYFEMLFAIAAVYFSKQDVDYVIYETGLGGRLDATNIVKPVITAITSIGLDHVAYLGDTVEKIAYEKAGIIKKGVPIVYNTGSIKADAVIEKQAKELCARAINVAKATYIVNEISDKTIDFSLCNSYYSYHKISLNVNGAIYQLDNAATAIELAYNLPADRKLLTEELINKAMELFLWPGRMERIGGHIVVDGAHNEDAAFRFVEAVKIINKDNPVNLLFAVSEDKDYEAMIRHLSGSLSLKRVFVTSIMTGRAADIKKVSLVFEKYRQNDMEIIVQDNLKDALKTGLDNVCSEGGTLFCVGSLYLVGGVKEIFREKLSYDKL